MNQIFTLARKDVSSYFYSWLGVLIFVIFFLMTGVLFSMLVTKYVRISEEAMQQGFANVEGLQMTAFIFGSFFLNLSLCMIFLVPLVSMKSFAEEKNLNSIELLFTYPLSDVQIVLGKFLGLLWFMSLLMAPTLIYAWLLQWFGGALDLGTLAAAYIGLFLFVSAFISFGLFVSSLTSNPITSALVTLGGFLMLWAFEWLTTVFQGQAAEVLKILSPLNHYREFTFGILDLSHITYFLFFCIYFLFLTLRSIESRNWKTE